MIDYKKSNAPKSTITRDNIVIESKVDGNIFEALVIASKRANQIQKDIKEELREKLQEFAGHTDNLEEVFENREQIEVSKQFERMPKPQMLGLQDLLEDKLFWRKPGEEKTEQEN